MQRQQFQSGYLYSTEPLEKVVAGYYLG
jgi:hypothetical protein